MTLSNIYDGAFFAGTVNGSKFLKHVLVKTYYNSLQWIVLTKSWIYHRPSMKNKIFSGPSVLNSRKSYL